VSACVAPNNAPCQTFTLFSTPSSRWTLETVSGSPQVVPAGQSFQPLVMRVTDGSLAANPVMGVTVTFETTLARVSPGQGGQPDGDSVVGANGMPVLLGSSQAQVGSTQDGLASIVPSVGSVGPCDVFITVSAGRSTAQLQMESVAAIVTGQQNNSPAKAPTAPPDPHFIPHFGSQTSAPQSAPEVLFAVPQGAPSNEPVADSHATTGPETADDASSNHGSSAASSPAVIENEKGASAPRPRSKLPKAKVPKKAARKQSQTAPASTKWSPEDKRSCHALAGDGPLF